MSDDARFTFQLADPYWNRLLYKEFHYEPEIAAALHLIKDLDYTFLDLGANYGFWSIMVSSAVFGAHRAIAVEPLGSDFDMLSRNWTLNDRRFRIRKEAITEKSGREVEIRTDTSSISNVGASVVSSHEDDFLGRTEIVPSISIDDLCAGESCSGKPLVVKLDVEDMEIDALKGAEKALKSETLFIYEDHGNDSECRVTEYMLGIGLLVYHCEGGEFTRVNRVEDVRKVQTQKTKGYNFFAFRGDTKFALTFANEARP